MSDYFSDRENGPRARTEETIQPLAWGGIVALIQSLISTGAFGVRFPDPCPDGQGPIGTDEASLELAVLGEIRGLNWPLRTTMPVEEDYVTEMRPFAPETLPILDLIEFCFRNIATPIQGSHHGFFGHYHLRFDVKDGQRTFCEDINRILSRNNLVYELRNNGLMVRLAPTVLGETLSAAVFRTGDSVLDSMLEESRTKFLDPKPNTRRESLERLWDCWERIKSLENPQNKKLSIEALLEKSSQDAPFRVALNEEAQALTNIGNTFHIRHAEIQQIVISDPSHIDYLFHRLYSLINLVLSKRGKS